MKGGFSAGIRLFGNEIFDQNMNKSIIEYTLYHTWYKVWHPQGDTMFVIPIDFKSLSDLGFARKY